jgi:hypothetical protein
MSYRSRLNSAQIFRIELGAFLRICKSVNSPRSLACYMLAEAGEWEQYLQLSFPDTMLPGFPDDYLVTEAMKKNPRLPNLAIDRKAVALAKFFESEKICAQTNARLTAYMQGGTMPPGKCSTVLSQAQKIIADTLGPLTRAKLEYAQAHFRFGPGATSSLSGRDVILSKKMTCGMQVTPRLYPYFRAITGPLWGQAISNVEIRAYSKVTTVPKSALTDRCIAIEPHLNIYVQLGIGALLRRQLLFAGLDLNTQKNNQVAAESAQKLGLATIDLSSASDTVSSELVWLMLPFDWASLLDVARTEYAEVDGQEVRLSKFSSMGNGYTFELESLIFWALAKACSSYSLAYGDDIIVRQKDAPLLIQTLEFLGFSVNGKKSFLAGDFFESCGVDIWRGKNVRPFYFRGDHYDLHSAVIRMANAIRRYASRRGYHIYCDRRFFTAWLYLTSRSSVARKTRIPNGYGDEGLVRDFDESSPPRAKHGLQGFIGRIYRLRPRRAMNTVIDGSYLASLAWGSFESSRANESWRGEFEGSQLTSIPCFSWDGLGPWY